MEVIRYRPFFIVGGVNRPGQFDYVPGMTVLQAVAIAGGYSLTGAQGQNVIISRNSRGSSGPSFGSMTTPVFPGGYHRGAAGPAADDDGAAGTAVLTGIHMMKPVHLLDATRVRVDEHS